MRPTILMCLALLLIVAPANAAPPTKTSKAMDDQILSEANDIISKYKAGDIQGALEAARLVETWLLELQAAGLLDVFRDLSGYEKEMDDATAMGSGMMGGGIAASCRYSKGEETIEASILGNNPMYAMVSGLIGNSFMASASGAKIIKLKGKHKAAVKEESGEFEIMVPFEGNTLVTVRGPDRDRSIACAENLDWELLGQIVSSQ